MHHNPRYSDVTAELCGDTRESWERRNGCIYPQKPLWPIDLERLEKRVTK